MPTNYNVTIKLSPATVAELNAEGASLYGLKAVSSTQRGGMPLVWFRDAKVLGEVTITWSDAYQAYVSDSEIVSHASIETSSSVKIDLGQTAQLGADNGLTVVSGGVKDAISIANQTSTRWACGIAQTIGDASVPTCAFPLFGNNLDIIAPVEKVLFFFATATVNPGTIVDKAYGPGVLVDLTSNQQLKVEYDINKGWDFGNASWATAVQAGADIAPLLVISDGALRAKPKKAATATAAAPATAAAAPKAALKVA